MRPLLSVAREAPPGDVRQLDVFDGVGLRTAFQPVVDLVSGTVVGYEALVRGAQEGTQLDPAGLLAAARAGGRLVDLDWACRSLALRSALLAGLRPPTLLFVNAEPESLAAPCPPALLRELAAAYRRLDVVVEVTERHLLRSPDQLLRAVEVMRGLGWQVALDDVGASDAGLALLPVLRPDVVKLDRSLLSSPGPDQQRTLDAVRAYAADTGAPVVAEGIETPQERDCAVALGATWGQGYLLGRPGTIDLDATTPAHPPLRAGRPSADRGDWDGAAFDLLAAQSPPAAPDRVSPDARIQELCALAGRAPSSALLLLTVPAPAGLSAQTWAELARMHDLCGLVSVLSAVPPPRQLPWVRVSRLDAGDPLSRECCAVLLSPAHAVAVVARAGGGATWDTVRSEDPRVVSRLARLLVARTGAVTHDGWY